MKGHCGHDESELQVFWVDRAYALKMLFLKVTASEADRAPADSGECGWVGPPLCLPGPLCSGGSRAPPPLGRKVTTRPRDPRQRGS